MFTNSVVLHIKYALIFFQLRQRASEGQALFGCVESWLLYRLTGNQVHATDYSCASATGLFDPYVVGFIICVKPI